MNNNYSCYAYKKHIENKGEEVKICKNCTFKDIYNWI